MSGGASAANPGTLGRSDRALAGSLRWGSIACLVGLWVMVAAGVFVRFVPISSMGWADEIVELAFAWMVFLGTAALWRERTHFRVELLPHLLTGSWAGDALEVLVDVVSLGFLLVFTYEGAILAMRATDRSPILEYTRTIFYIVMPLAGIIMIGYSVHHLWTLLRGPTGQSPKREAQE